MAESPETTNPEMATPETATPETATPETTTPSTADASSNDTGTQTNQLLNSSNNLPKSRRHRRRYSSSTNSSSSSKEEESAPNPRTRLRRAVTKAIPDNLPEGKIGEKSDSKRLNKPDGNGTKKPKSEKSEKRDINHSEKSNSKHRNGSNSKQIQKSAEQVTETAPGWTAARDAYLTELKTSSKTWKAMSISLDKPVHELKQRWKELQSAMAPEESSSQDMSESSSDATPEKTGKPARRIEIKSAHRRRRHVSFSELPENSDEVRWNFPQ
jgi:hypothetical protein